jgi:hypothetical protein
VACLKWLNSLHLIETPPASAPIICVPVSARAPAGGKWRASYAFGFLEKDDPSGCVVQLLDFEPHSVHRNEWGRCEVAPENVVRKLTALEAAKLWCEWLDTESQDEHSSRTWGRMEDFAQMTFLAAVMEQRGEHGAATMLLRRARKEQRRHSEHGVTPREFDNDVKHELADALLRSVEIAFGDLKIPRTALEPRLAEIVRHFPKTEAATVAGPMLKFLRIVIEPEPQMAKDRLDDDALAKLPVKERVACLIRLLPDQTGEQWTIPGICDIFTDDGGVTRWRSVPPVFGPPKPRPSKTPAGKLVQIGLAAVPQLVEVLDDRRPTRAVVGYGQPTCQHSKVLDVGDCAYQILEMLAGRQFFGNASGSDANAARAQMKRDVEAWRKERSAAEQGTD